MVKGIITEIYLKNVNVNSDTAVVAAAGISYASCAA